MAEANPRNSRLFSIANEVEKVSTNITTFWINQPSLLDLFKVLHEYLTTNEISILMPVDELKAATAKLCDEFTDYPHFTDEKMFEMGGTLFDREIYGEAVVLFIVSARLYAGGENPLELVECCRHIGVALMEIYSSDGSTAEMVEGNITMIVGLCRELLPNVDEVSRVERLHAESKCVYWKALTLHDVGNYKAFKDSLFESFDLLDKNLPAEEKQGELYEDLEMWARAYEVSQTTCL